MWFNVADKNTWFLRRTTRNTEINIRKKLHILLDIKIWITILIHYNLDTYIDMTSLLFPTLVSDQWNTMEQMHCWCTSLSTYPFCLPELAFWQWNICCGHHKWPSGIELHTTSSQVEEPNKQILVRGRAPVKQCRLVGKVEWVGSIERNGGMLEGEMRGT